MKIQIKDNNGDYQNINENQIMSIIREQSDYPQQDPNINNSNGFLGIVGFLIGVTIIIYIASKNKGQ